MQIKETDVPKEGLVISYFGNQVSIETSNGELSTCYLRRNQTLPVVGDRVTFIKETEEAGVVLEVLPRKSLLARGEGHGRMKGIAANVDLVVVVMSPPPVFSEYLIDRYILATHLLHITPLVLVNKADLLTKEDQRALTKRLDLYRDASYQVLFSSVKKKGGLTQLKKALKNKTVVLVGPSGVGKSSIIGGLLKTDHIKIGDVSAKGTGKHTTTATTLYHLPNGGQIIDSPGVREFTLWPVTLPEVKAGFLDFDTYAAECKFRNCLHINEPHCAVQSALAAGKISAQRYAMYQTLIKEIKKHTHD